MTLSTPFCALVGAEYPIVQAPIGSATCPGLATAVSAAGGLGSLAVTWRSFEETRAAIRETADAVDAFAVNLVLDDATAPHDPEEHLDVCLSAGAPVVSLSFGDPTPYVDRIHDAGAVVLATVGDAQAARRAAEAGVDAVVAQGWEAGGHLQGDVATMPLVPRVADAVDVPVVAAGGIADGRGVAAALALGADAAWLGTRFLATPEARIHPTYRDRVLGAVETDTHRSELFDKGWPGRPHRVVENATVREWESAGRPPPGDRPGETDVVAETPDGEGIRRYDEALATPDVEGDVDEMALFAGQSGGLVDSETSAATVVEELVAETRAAVADVSALG